MIILAGAPAFKIHSHHVALLQSQSHLFPSLTSNTFPSPFSFPSSTPLSPFPAPRAILPHVQNAAIKMTPCKIWMVECPTAGCFRSSFSFVVDTAASSQIQNLTQNSSTCRMIKITHIKKLLMQTHSQLTHSICPACPHWWLPCLFPYCPAFFLAALPFPLMPEVLPCLNIWHLFHVFPSISYNLPV